MGENEIPAEEMTITIICSRKPAAWRWVLPIYEQPSGQSDCGK